MAGTTINPYRFGGQLGYRRDGVNRNYVRARNLDTQRGRWISRDPNGFEAEDFNLYCYVTNGPVNYADPEGNIPQSFGELAAHPKPVRHKHPPTAPWDSPACGAVRSAAESALGACFDSSMASTIATIMQCIAYAESSCNPQESSSGSYGPNGLFQLGCDQYNACRPSCCPPCTGNNGTTPGPGSGILQRGCNTQVTVAFIHWLFDQFKGPSLGSILCQNFGVLPCPPKRPSPQNEQAMRCLAAKGIDPFRTPRPNPLPTCPKCSKSPTH